MGALLGALPARGATTTPSVLVVPARHTLLQLALDMVRLRGVTLVSYRTTAEDTFHFYRWQPTARQWAEMSSLGPVPQDERFTLIVGSGSDRTFSISQTTSWPSPVHEVPSLDLAHLVNRLHGAYHLTPGEWRWLAARYGLTLKDRNYLRRKYGRYGPPGSRAPQREPAPTPAPQAMTPAPEATMDAAPSEGFDPGETAMEPASLSDTVEVDTSDVEPVEVKTVEVPVQETLTVDEPILEEKGGATAPPVTLDIEPDPTPAQDLPLEYK